MSSNAEDFIQKFHSLEGTTIAQRRKSFFTLLHESGPLKTNEEVLDAIATNLNARTFLEELFKVEFLIYFRRKKEMFEILKEGNDVFVSKITKQRWFFQEVFNEVEVQQLVNDILPSMSYSVRMKVLKKLSQCLSSDQFDKIFDAVTLRYGIFIASQFITGCSSGKVFEVMKCYKVKLTQVQLIIMYRKDPNLLEFYFTNVDKPHSRKYGKVFKFLYSENANLYNSFKEQFKLANLKLGRRLTKKFVVSKRDEIISTPHNFSYLYMKAVIRKIGKDAVKLFCNSLPYFEDVSDVSSLRFLQYFATKYRYNLIFKTIPHHYQIKYIDHPKLITSNLLELETDNEKRSFLAQVRVDRGEDEYIKYLTLDKSIPLLKDKLNVTSDIWNRHVLIQYMLETPNINKDLNGLVEVMRYYIKRHKNDDPSVFCEFRRRIEFNYDFEDFNEEMWNLYNEAIITYALKHDTNFETYKKLQTKPLAKFFVGNSNHQKFSYLNFLFKANKPVVELIQEFFSEDIVYPQWGKYGKDFEKYILMYIIDEAEKKIFEKVYDKLSFHCNLINQICSWNNQYSDDQLNFCNYQFLMDAFNNALNSDKYNYLISGYAREIFRDKIFTTANNACKDEYLQIYWNHLTQFKNESDFNWFLKYDPKIIEKYFEKFFNKVIEDMNNNSGKIGSGRYSRYRRRHWPEMGMWYKIKKFSHLNFDEKAIQFCRSKINDNGSDSDPEYKPQYVDCLSKLLKPEDYVALADEYKPENKKLDLQNEKEVRLFNLQCAIGENFKNTKNCKVLPSLFNYCAGDYFHHSLKSLYSILYRTPEKMLPNHLNYLAKKAVSVRKHALYFTCELTTVEQVDNMLKLLNKSEGVLSLQKYLFSATIKFFLKNPLDNFFEMVKSNLMFITKDDDESQKLIVEKCPHIPIEYRISYIQCSWEHFERVIEIQQNLQRLKNDLLSQMLNEDVLVRLPLEFVLKVVRQHFLATKEELILYQIPAFVFSVLVHRDEKSIILDTIFELVSRCNCKTKVSGLFGDWYKKILLLDKADLKFLEPYIDYFDQKIKVIEDFDDYVRILFLRTKIAHPENTFDDNFIEMIYKIFENLIGAYGSRIITMFSKKLTNYLGIIEQEFDDRQSFCLKLITKYPTADVAELILEVMSSSVKKKAKILLVLKEVEKIPDPTIKIILNSRFADYYKKCNCTNCDKT